MFDSFQVRRQEWLEEHPRVEAVTSKIGSWLPPLNFITIHYAYFIIVIAASSLIFWGSSSTFGNVTYIDSLFLVTSALTNTGLSTRNLSEVTTWQQVQLWFLLMIGSPIWVSFWTVLVRKRAFEKRFDNIVEAERERRRLHREQRKSSGIRRAPNLRSMIPFSKARSASKLDSSVPPGLGPPLPTPGNQDSFGHELATMGHREQDGTRATSPQLETIPSSPERQDSSSLNNSELTVQPTAASQLGDGRDDHISFMEPIRPPGFRKQHSQASAYQHGNHLAPIADGRRSSDGASAISEESEDFMMHWKKFLGKHNTSRSGQFYDLSSDEREHLGGCEYRALKVLAVAVPLYSALWQFLGAVALASWIATRQAEIPRADSQNPWWTGIFYSVSAFNNGGFTLIDDSVVPFQSDYFVLFAIGLLILAGNTAYPIFLRLVIWSIWKILQLTTEPKTLAVWKETLEFILKYPRRVYTTLFPSRATWWLFAVLVATNIVDWLAFEILNIGNPEVDKLPVGDQIMAGLFQAICKSTCTRCPVFPTTNSVLNQAVRAAGFVVISVSVLYIGVQVLYLIMMYVSIYPVVITMRSSNVYEERSLGIYDDDDPAIKEQQRITNPFASGQEPEKKHGLRRRNTAAVVGKQLRKAATFQGVGVGHRPRNDEETSRISFIGQQIRGQLAHDLWWLVIAILIIAIIETNHFNKDPVTYSVFNILFEGTSAYACVGLSVGLPNDAFSFSGGLHTGSKLVLCFVMLRGRHRGLPVAIDRAVRLPGDKMRQEEEEDTRIRRNNAMQLMMSREG